MDQRGREMEAGAVVKEKLAEAAGTSVYVPLATKSRTPFNIGTKPKTSRS